MGAILKNIQISIKKTRFALDRFVLEIILTWLQSIKSEFWRNENLIFENSFGMEALTYFIFEIIFLNFA